MSDLEVTLQFRLLRCKQLPKVSLLSHIDPFVRLRSTQQHTFETPVLKNNPDPEYSGPIWYVEATLKEDGSLSGSLKLDLLDKDWTGETYVGSSLLKLEDWSHEVRMEGRGGNWAGRPAQPG